MSNDVPSAADRGSGFSAGLGALVEVLAAWEDKHGSMAGILPSEWAELGPAVAEACITQSPRMLRNELRGREAARQELVDAWNEIPESLRTHPWLTRLYRAAQSA